MWKPNEGITPTPMRMLYRYPGSILIEGKSFDTIQVSEMEKEKYIEDGWALTTNEAFQKFIDIDVDNLEESAFDIKNKLKPGRPKK